MNGKRGIIDDPDYKGFDGLYIGVKGMPAKLEYNIRDMLRYAKTKGIAPEQITKKEREKFKIKR